MVDARFHNKYFYNKTSGLIRLCALASTPDRPLAGQYNGRPNKVLHFSLFNSAFAAPMQTWALAASERSSPSHCRNSAA
jgi:hypothetical protein